jgi:hypothetical protein
LVIIAVSYDAASLNRRIETLEQVGHIVIPASSLATARKAIETSSYHVLLVGATVSPADRENLATLSRKLHRQSKIVSVEPTGSHPLKLADRRVLAGDETAMILALTSLISGESESEIEGRRR